MSARDFFERIQDDQRRIEQLRRTIDLARQRVEPHSSGFGSIGGHGAGSDTMFGMVMARLEYAELSDIEKRLPKLQRDLERRMSYATCILYGKSGNGGLSKARSTVDADILCLHYLQGVTWAEIVKEYLGPDIVTSRSACQMRALRACRYIDRVGMRALVDS